MSKLKDRALLFRNWFFKLSFLKKISIILLILFIIWIGLRSTILESSKTPQFRTTQVQRGTIITTVNESGNVTSSDSAGVGSPTTGIIQEMYVSDGQSVTKGVNLFKVKSIATAQEIATAWATYQSAVASADSTSQGKILDQATLEKDRAAVISASEAVTVMQNNGGLNGVNPATKQNYTQNDIDGINSALISARETFSADEQKYNQVGTSIAAASASVNSAYLAYQATQDSIVTAPIDGIVANIAVKVGDEVTASGGNLSSNSSTTTSSSTNAVLSIGNFSTPYIKVQASEVDIPNIHTGQKATVTLSAFPGKTFVGDVDQVDSVGTITSGVVTYNVFVQLISPPESIMPGMSALVTIQTNRKDDVLTVPSSALQISNGQVTVRVFKDGKLSSVNVSTGLASDTDTEVTSGLSEGELVITGIISNSGGASGGVSGATSPFSRRIGGFGGGRPGGGG